MPHRPAVVVSGIGKRNALLRLLEQECREAGARLIGCDAIPSPPARLEIDDFFLLPLASESGFPSAHAAVVEETQADAYLTLIDPEIVPLGKIAAGYAEKGIQHLHPVASTAAICEDKYLFFKTMSDNDIVTIPTSLTPLNEFPFIRKDRFGSASSGFKVYDRREDVGDISGEQQPGRYIYQPFCSGRHHCVDAYFSIKDGRLVDLCVKEVLVKTNGESYLLRSVDKARFKHIIQSIADVLPMRGIVNFDVYDDDGILTVMEVNCRIGGNYPVSHGLGANFLRLMIQEAIGEADAVLAPFEYEPDLVVAKYFEFSAAVPLSKAGL